LIGLIFSWCFSDNVISEPANVIYEFGPFLLEVKEHRLVHEGRAIPLTGKAFETLRVLVERHGTLVSKRDLMNAVWPETTVEENNLDRSISAVRKALGKGATGQQYIETVPRVGYRFVARLSVRQANRYRFSGTLAASPARIESLVVLPLENLSRDPEQEYFADGLTEALITSLAKIGALRVVSRTSAMQYKGVRKSLREIARELQVDGVIEGTVQRSGKRLRISAQLLHAPSDTHLWAESYDRDLRDVLALQSEVARAIANEVQVKLTPLDQARLAEVRRVNPEAFEANLKGRYHWNKRPVELGEASRYFQQAIAKDPTYAAAYAGLADCLSGLSAWGLVPANEGCVKAKGLAQRAIEMDHSSAEAHASLAACGASRMFDL
jgi:TolB-like protein